MDTFKPNTLYRWKLELMIRTQIELPEELYRRAKKVAKQHEISLAEMTRRGLEIYLDRISQRASPTAWESPQINGGGVRVALETLHGISAARDER